MITTYDLAAAAWTPKAEFVVRTPPSAQLTLVRFWIGWFEARPDLLTSTSTGIRLAAFYYEETGAGMGSWFAVVSNGVQTPTSIGIGTTVGQNLTYRMTVEIQSTQVVFELVLGLTTHTQTITLTPGSTEYLGLGVRATTTSSAQRSISWRRASWRPYPI